MTILSADLSLEVERLVRGMHAARPTKDETLRVIALAEANKHCQGRFEPASVLDVADLFQAYIRTGQNMMKPMNGEPS